MKKVIDQATQTITFTFDQTSAPGTAPIVFHASAVHDNMSEYAMLHGFAARIGDNAALSRDTKTGKAPSEAERFAAVKELVDHYESGIDQWSIRAPGQAKVKSLNPTILAIATKRGITYEEAEAYIAEKFLADMGD